MITSFPPTLLSKAKEEVCVPSTPRNKETSFEHCTRVARVEPVAFPRRSPPMLVPVLRVISPGIPYEPESTSKIPYLMLMMQSTSSVDDYTDMTDRDWYPHLARFRLLPFFGFSNFTTDIVWICCAKNSCVPCLMSHIFSDCHPKRMGCGRSSPHPQDPHDHLCVPGPCRLSSLRTLPRLNCPEVPLRHK